MAVTAKRCVFVGANKQPMLLFEAPEQGLSCHEGQVLVKIRFATICSSDIHTVKGRRIEQTPLVLGHEAVGEIVEDRRPKGAGGDEPLQMGTKVTFSIAASCLQCDMCGRNITQKCQSLFKYGHTNITRGSGFSGCYATHIILVPNTKIIPITNHNIPDPVLSTINCAMATAVNLVEKATLGFRGPLGVAYAARRAWAAHGKPLHYRSDIECSHGLVQGAGLLGIYCCALLHNKGYTVYCSEKNIARSQMAARFGAQPIDTQSNALDGQMDCVIEACGSSSVVARGIKYLRFGGTYVFGGMVHADTKLDVTGDQIIRKCATIKGVHNYGPRHLERAVEFLSETFDKYPYKDLVNPRSYNLEKIEEATKASEDGFYWRTGIDFETK